MVIINHIAIYANDMAKMLFFYSNILGFTEIKRVYHENGMIKMIGLAIGDEQMIELFNFNFQNNEMKHKYVNWGFMHVGFAVDRINDIKRKIEESGVAIEELSRGNDGLKHLFIFDPERNLLEFTEISKG